MKPGFSHCGWSTRRFLMVPLVTRICLPRETRDLVTRTCHLVAIYRPGVTPESTAGFPLRGVSDSTQSQDAPSAGDKMRHRCMLSSCHSSLKIAKLAFHQLRDPQGSSVLWSREKLITQWMGSPHHLCSSGKMQSIGDPQRGSVWPLSLQDPVPALSSLFCWKTKQKLWGGAAGYAACVLEGTRLQQPLVLL